MAVFLCCGENLPWGNANFFRLCMVHELQRINVWGKLHPQHKTAFGLRHPRFGGEITANRLGKQVDLLRITPLHLAQITFVTAMCEEIRQCQLWQSRRGINDSRLLRD